VAVRVNALAHTPLNEMAMPQNSHDANARNVRAAVMRLGQMGCAKRSARLMTLKVTFGFSGKIQSAENGPANMEHYRENRAGEMDVFKATRKQSPVAKSTSKVTASANTRNLAGHDAYKILFPWAVGSCFLS
jgi:hypothetical protein